MDNAIACYRYRGYRSGDSPAHTEACSGFFVQQKQIQFLGGSRDRNIFNRELIPPPSPIVYPECITDKSIGTENLHISKIVTFFWHLSSMQCPHEFFFHQGQKVETYYFEFHQGKNRVGHLAPLIWFIRCICLLCPTAGHASALIALALNCMKSTSTTSVELIMLQRKLACSVPSS